MTLRSSDLQSDSDLDSIRNSCNVFSIQFLFWYTTKTLVASPMGQLYITDAALNHPPLLLLLAALPHYSIILGQNPDVFPKMR